MTDKKLKEARSLIASVNGKKGWSSLSKEKRAKRAKKGWVTRRAKSGSKSGKNKTSKIQ